MASLREVPIQSLVEELMARSKVLAFIGTFEVGDSLQEVSTIVGNEAENYLALGRLMRYIEDGDYKEDDELDLSDDELEESLDDEE